MIGFLRRRFMLVTVRGDSMMPTLRPDQRVLVRLGRPFSADDVVVFRTAAEHVSLMIKRVAAAPGEAVPDDMRDVVGDVVVPDGFVLVRGDNPLSVDSRTFGYLPADAVVGLVRTPK
ncbi:peptidase S24 [Lentzea tibetensis]|uniref:Mitochondrial inner membrane protease subunit 2 n=1 Tax=Lentzea tibetensis TaxID=2591470 RepID=A0A563EWS6_9PSEU|nr:S24/S26 family peptidase [Lentzea tibetensis]TWP52155.1 peptidase S24 [Lentzea tibetensis]